MTTKFHDNKTCTFKILLSWRFPTKKKKQRFGRFSSLPPRPPSKGENFILIVVSPSLNFNRALGAQKASSKHCQTSTSKQREL